MDLDDVWRTIDTERAGLADLFEDLSPTEWETPSLCDAWRVRDVAVHLTQAHMGPGAAVVASVRAGGRFDRMIRDSALRATPLSPTECARRLRAMVGSRRMAPFLTPMQPLIDVLVHGQDITIPLGRTRPIPVAAAAAAARKAWDLSFSVPRPEAAGRVAPLRHGRRLGCWIRSADRGTHRRAAAPGHRPRRRRGPADRGRRPHPAAPRGDEETDMTWGVTVDVAAPVEMYDAMHAALLERVGPDVEGLLVHLARATGDGFQLIEVWESKADHDRYVDVVRQVVRELSGGTASLESAAAERPFEVRGLVLPRAGIAV